MREMLKRFQPEPFPKICPISFLFLKGLITFWYSLISLFLVFFLLDILIALSYKLIILTGTTINNTFII